MQRLFLVILSLLMTIAPAACAHVDSGGAGSLLSGLLHPVTGWIMWWPWWPSVSGELCLVPPHSGFFPWPFQW